MYVFEYDLGKSQVNKEKHGIDFQKAQQLWEDADGIEIRANCEVEPRFIFIGLIGRKHWSAVFTYRSEKIRLISVRRSRVKEIKLYESYRLRQKV